MAYGRISIPLTENIKEYLEDIAHVFVPVDYKTKGDDVIILGKSPYIEPEDEYELHDLIIYDIMDEFGNYEIEFNVVTKENNLKNL